MAEGFEPYHVPQQSRREKLRVLGQSLPVCIENLQSCTNLASLYDPSIISSDLLNSDPSGVKEEGVNFTGFSVGGTMNIRGSCSSPSATHHLYMDPQTSIQLNPTSIQDINSNPYLYTPQSLRFLDQSFHGGEIEVYKPEPLSVTHAANNASGQGLSLSLSSPQSHQNNHPLELNLQRYDPSMFCNKVTDGCLFNSISGGSGSNEFSRSMVPLGPFTGYASILKGSRFLKPAQQLLDELCDAGRGIYAEKFVAESGLLMDPLLDSYNNGSGIVVDDPQSCSEGSDSRRKSRLISMLHEVYRRYKQYYQQMQAVVTSFESVAGLSNAAPFANLALNSMSKHFRNLRNAITDQLQFTTKSQDHIDYEKDEIPRRGTSGRGPYCQRPAQPTAANDHQPAWRPQRGLPERAVSVLRAWLFEHFLHPYPTDTDKMMLAKQTGLSRNQVSNWFINARVRLWKPMVEEIHMLETQQVKGSQRKELDTNKPNDHLTANNSVPCENPSKRTRADTHDVSDPNEQPIHLSYDNFSHHPHLAIGASTAGGSNGVSLTLGLHQNIGIGPSEQFPVNAARRFGLDANSEGYVSWWM